LAIVVREFVPSDREEVVGLLLELQRYERQFEPDYAMPDRAFGEWYFDRLLGELREHEGVLVVAILDGTTCGFCAGLDDDSAEERSQYFYIAELAVSEATRGRGVGTRLIAAMEDLARARNHKMIEIGVLANNQRVYALYNRLGYRDRAVRLRKKL
jgi:ribosomal protein S18 acetylase RimI-like enzyme